MTLQLDEVDPIIDCGFNDADSLNKVSPDGKILFVYAGDKLLDLAYEKGTSELQDTNLFYNITVSRGSQAGGLCDTLWT